MRTPHASTSSASRGGAGLAAGEPREGQPLSEAPALLRLPPGFTLSVLKPVCNQHGTLPEILDRVLAVDLPKEVIIVDDGSTHGARQHLTIEAVPEASADRRRPGWPLRAASLRERAHGRYRAKRRRSVVAISGARLP